MYEKPELTSVGEAQDTILGVFVDGGDFDMTYQWIPGGGSGND